MTVPDDVATLVVAARAGDRAAFAVLHERFGRVVHAIVLAKVTSQAAPDLVQDVFLTAWSRLPTLAEPAAFPGWICRIARNAATDHVRSRRESVELPETLSTRPDAAAKADAARVLAAIRALPETYAETLSLRLVEGLTGPEIAERTGMTPGSVRVNLHRGMKLLRESLS